MFMHPFEGMDVANINGKKRKLDAEAGIDDASRMRVYRPPVFNSFL